MLNSSRVEEREDLRLLHTSCVSELAFFKTQQWSVTNYTLLAYAGVVAVGQLVTPSVVLGATLVLACVAILIAGLSTVMSLGKAIVVRQDRLLYVRSCNLMTEVFRQAWEAKLKEPDVVRVHFALNAAIILGFALSVLVVVVRNAT